MKMIPINQFLEVIKKQGAVGVLALWLTYTHFEVQDVKDRLYNCLDRNEYINRKPAQDIPMEKLPALKIDTVTIFENKKRKLAKI